jgi:ABC-type branched-subunit amino acid transport system ATPase component
LPHYRNRDKTDEWFRMTTPNPILTIQGLHAGYRRKEVLQGLSLELHRSEVIAILGDNGTGKSTMLRAIAGLLTPSSGRISLMDRDVTLWTAKHRHDCGVGFLMQGGRVFPNLSVLQNFELARYHRPSSALDLDRRLGSIFPSLAAIADQRAGLLSGGQRQMLSIEMAAQQCGVIGLWDEPTAGLSPENAQFALDHIIGLAQGNRAQLIVEQRQELIVDRVNRILWMETLTLGGHRTHA